MRWTQSQLEHFEARRSFKRPSGETITTASVRPQRAGRKPRAAGSEPTELSIHMAIAGHLRQRAAANVFWCHYPAGELRDPSTASKLKAMGQKTGVPDFVLVIGGRMFGLELKRHDGRLSPDQRVCQAEIEGAGGFCATAWGVDSALAILTAWGALKPTTGAPQIAESSINV